MRFLRPAARIAATAHHLRLITVPFTDETCGVSCASEIIRGTLSALPALRKLREGRGTHQLWRRQQDPKAGPPGRVYQNFAQTD